MFTSMPSPEEWRCRCVSCSFSFLRLFVRLFLRLISLKKTGGDRVGAGEIQQLLDDVQTLHSLKGELDSIQGTVREKNDSFVALHASKGLAEKNRAVLLKLCDLHPEFLSVSAVSSRSKDIALRCGIVSGKRPAVVAEDDDGARNPLRVGPPRGPRRPAQPNPYYPDLGGYDPFAREPDPDHMRPPGMFGDDDDDDRDINPFPIFPGQQPPPGGPGGVRAPPFGGPGRPGFPPGYNPDFDRDLNPLGPFGPQGGRGNRPPPGPFNPGGGFGGTGGPRFL